MSRARISLDSSGTPVAGTRLFVGNIPYATSEQDLRDLFARSGGAVRAVHVVTDLDSGRPRGYAFVEMTTAAEAQKAILELHNFNMGGRALVVAEARAQG